MKLSSLCITALILLFSFSLHTHAQDSLTVKQDSLNRPVPTEILLKKITQHDFTISPDGKYIAEVVENNVENDIVIIDIDGYKIHHQIPMGKVSVDNLYWLSSKRLLYESSGEILAIDIDGTNSTLLVDRLADKPANTYRFYKNLRINSVISFLPKDKKNILIEAFDYSAYASVKKVNIYTGEKQKILDGKFYKVNKWIPDAWGNIRFGIRYDDEEIRYLILDPETNKLRPFTVSIEGQEIPLRIKATSYLDQSINFEGCGFDPNIVYLTSNIGSDKRKLLTYNISERRVEKVLLEDVNCDVKDPHGEDIYLFFDAAAQKLAGVRYEGLTPQFKWFSEKFAGIHAEISKQYPMFINELIDTDAAEERLLIYQWSDTNAGNIGVYNVKDSVYTLMLNLNDELNKYKLSKTRSVIAKARDGHKLPCYLNLPLGYSKDSLQPLVVIPHGGPWARDYLRLDDFSQYFASRGYATLRVNFRGSTGFGRDHVMAGVKSIDGVMINDIADAVNYIADTYAIDRKRIFIFGHSYGGYATYMSLIKYPDLYACGVALSAPSNIKDWMKLQKKEKNYFSYEFWNAALGSKQSKYLNQISPVHHAEALEKPLLIFHGKRDDVIPVEQAREMIEALKKYNKNAKLEVLQREGHSITDSNSLGYILDSAKEFFDASGKQEE